MSPFPYGTLRGCSISAFPKAPWGKNKPFLKAHGGQLEKAHVQRAGR